MFTTADADCDGRIRTFVLGDATMAYHENTLRFREQCFYFSVNPFKVLNDVEIIVPTSQF